MKGLVKPGKSWLITNHIRGAHLFGKMNYILAENFSCVFE